MIRDSVIDWQELSDLYERADGLDEGALAVFLEQLGSQKHRLLGQLERMLAARARIATGTFLESLPNIPAAPHSASGWREGSRIGAYRLIRPIGSGGMAEVWLAERADGAFERQVAIKLLFTHPSRAERESFVERFRRERDILASLHHPHIAALHDAGVTPDGQPWLALEHVQGQPITDWCKAGRLSTADRVVVFRQVMLAVEHAHANLIIHRDLKPSNILVTATGDVKLLDFGIAKLFQVQGGTEDSEITRDVGRPLTPQYASPEQLEGRPLTTVSDVYSLGVVLHLILLGVRPDAIDRASAPSAIGKDLQAVLAKMLERSPQERYSSVEAARNDLERWQRGVPVTARRSTPGYVAMRFFNRHRWGSIFTAIGLASLLVFATVAIVSGAKARQESQRAVAARDFVLDLFRIVDPDHARNGDVSARRMLEVGRRKAAVALGAQPLLLADVLVRIGLMQTYIGDYPQAESTLTEAAKIYRDADLPAEALRVDVALADVAFHMGHTDRAIRLARAASDAAAAYRQDDALYAKLLLLQGWLSQVGNDTASARTLMTDALQHANRAYGDADSRTIEVLQGLSAVERSAGNFDTARSYIRDAMARVERGTNIGPRDRVAIDTSWLRLELAVGRYASALDSGGALLDRCDEQLGERSEDCQVLRGILANALLTAGERSRASRLLPKLMANIATSNATRRRAESTFLALRIVAANHDSGHRASLQEMAAQAARDPLLDVRTRIFGCLALSEAHLADADGDAAELWARDALMLTSREATASPLQVGRSRMFLGLALQLRSRDEEALKMFALASEAHRQALGADHPLLAVFRLNEAVSLVAVGSPDEASRLIDGVLPVLRSSFGPTSALAVRASELKEKVSKAKRATPAASGYFDFFS